MGTEWGKCVVSNIRTMLQAPWGIKYAEMWCSLLFLLVELHSMCAAKGTFTKGWRMILLGKSGEFQTQLPILSYHSHPTVKNGLLCFNALPLNNHANDHILLTCTVYLAWGWGLEASCFASYILSSLFIFVALFHGRDPLKMCNPLISCVFSRNPNRFVMKGNSICWLLW